MSQDEDEQDVPVGEVEDDIDYEFTEAQDLGQGRPDDYDAPASDDGPMLEHKHAEQEKA